MLVLNSLDLDEKPSYSVSHPNPSYLHMVVLGGLRVSKIANRLEQRSGLAYVFMIFVPACLYQALYLFQNILPEISFQSNADVYL